MASAHEVGDILHWMEKLDHGAAKQAIGDNVATFNAIKSKLPKDSIVAWVLQHKDYLNWKFASISNGTKPFLLVEGPCEFSSRDDQMHSDCLNIFIIAGSGKTYLVCVHLLHASARPTLTILLA